MSMKSPVPIFDDIKHIDEVDLKATAMVAGFGEETLRDYTHALAFLKSYRGSQGTFNSYRREVERLLHWCNIVVGKSLSHVWTYPIMQEKNNINSKKSKCSHVFGLQLVDQYMIYPIALMEFTTYKLITYHLIGFIGAHDFVSFFVG